MPDRATASPVSDYGHIRQSTNPEIMDLSSLGNIAKTVIDNKDTLAEGAKSLTGMFRKSPKQEKPDVSSQAASSTPAIDSSSYSPGLERMIALALEDGNLTDEEVALLVKRAEKEGVDPDEFEFDLRMRMKAREKAAEKMRDINPVEALSNAFKAIERNATPSRKAIDGGALSSALALIPGVGQAAAVGGLVASFIESPSNRNELKAEIIRVFAIPDRCDHLQQFISYASSQITEEHKKRHGRSSLKSMISSLAMGEELDIIPIWESKLEEACDKATAAYPDNELIMKSVRKNRPTLLNKLRNGLMELDELEDYHGPMPQDPEDLVGIVELLYTRKQGGSDDWDDLKKIHAEYYARAERAVAKESPLNQRLQKCKVRKFGLF